jgi:hypothetical protein
MQICGQQWEALSNFIEGDGYLRSRKGTYAERNGDRLKNGSCCRFKISA